MNARINRTLRVGVRSHCRHDGHIANLLAAYLDGSMTIRRCVVVEAHLADCEPCAKKWDRLADEMIGAPVRLPAGMQALVLHRPSQEGDGARTSRGEAPGGNDETPGFSSIALQNPGKLRDVRPVMSEEAVGCLT